ncbi:hypothetical protein FGO68_gene13416 [Halteria grandinella]|uniref:Uncharacterized protein n=1 Tax=Halteria grandinella TaxID=5974 RepID=A0A8J8NUG6_HALGN|nr:hypothetical protein FGO68_gene13416 [Halteria grandinella]
MLEPTLEIKENTSEQNTTVSTLTEEQWACPAWCCLCCVSRWKAFKIWLHNQLESIKRFVRQKFTDIAFLLFLLVLSITVLFEFFIFEDVNFLTKYLLPIIRQASLAGLLMTIKNRSAKTMVIERVQLLKVILIILASAVVAVGLSTFINWVAYKLKLRQSVGEFIIQSSITLIVSLIVELFVYLCEKIRFQSHTDQRKEFIIVAFTVILKCICSNQENYFDFYILKDLGISQKFLLVSIILLVHVISAVLQSCIILILRNIWTDCYISIDEIFSLVYDDAESQEIFNWLIKENFISDQGLVLNKKASLEFICIEKLNKTVVNNQKQIESFLKQVVSITRNIGGTCGLTTVLTIIANINSALSKSEQIIAYKAQKAFTGQPLQNYKPEYYRNFYNADKMKCTNTDYHDRGGGNTELYRLLNNNKITCNSLNNGQICYDESFSYLLTSKVCWCRIPNHICFDLSCTSNLPYSEEIKTNVLETQMALLITRPLPKINIQLHQQEERRRSISYVRSENDNISNSYSQNLDQNGENGNINDTMSFIRGSE